MYTPTLQKLIRLQNDVDQTFSLQFTEREAHVQTVIPSPDTAARDQLYSSTRFLLYLFYYDIILSCFQNAHTIVLRCCINSMRAVLVLLDTRSVVETIQILTPLSVEKVNLTNTYYIYLYL